MRRHHRRIRERSTLKWLPATCVGVGLLAHAGAASAQPLDANPPIPDVMLLLDTSGSMELLMDGCNTDTGLFTDGTGGGCCYNGTGCEIPCVALGTNCAAIDPSTVNGYCDGVTPRTPNRWAAQIQALAGSFLNSAATGLNYSCLSMSRSTGSSFANEFSYQNTSTGFNVPPYDLNYYLNYHRPVEPTYDATGVTVNGLCAFGFQQGPTPSWDPSSSTLHDENPSSGPSDFTYANIQGYQYSFTPVTATSPATMTEVPALSHETAGGNPTTCPMKQANDGLIEYGSKTIRFGMMTIDSDPAANTGVQNATGNTADLTFNDVGISGVTNLTTGMWSYYDHWWQATSPTWGTGSPGAGATSGKPAGCPDCISAGNPAGCDPATVGNIFFEVGARNPAAPPWEGRMIGFPPGSTASPVTNNNTIITAIDAMRPYGSNPIAGLMDDAKYYFWNDPEGPNGSGIDSLNACRPQYVILFSHAAPNQDLEPYCQGGPAGTSTQGMCPYDYPENIAEGLARGSYDPTQGVVNNQSAKASGPNNSTNGKFIQTFVVGFALDSSVGDAGAYTSCKNIISGGTILTDAAHCGTPGTTGADSGTADNPTYAACCALARIAVKGGTGAPYFADNQSDLNVALANILAIIVANTSTRATPVVLPQVSSSNAGTNDPALFVSSFNASTKAAWSGDVQRELYTCPATNPPYQPVVPADGQGNDFQYNLNNSPGVNRHVIMVEPAAASATNGCSGTATCPGATIRPYVKGQTGSPPVGFDGYSVYDGTEWGYDYKMNAGTGALSFLSGVSSGTIPAPGITSNALFTSETATNQACGYSQPGMKLTDADCEIMALGWLLGMSATPPDWNSSLGTIYPSRFYSSGVTNSPSPLGGVYHSTPVISTPPSALLRDDTYQAFAQYYTSNYAASGSVNESRHTVLYVATTDGLLHAFGVDYNSSDPYTFNGNSHTTEGGTAGIQNEMWSFVPPAVLPQLMSSVGGGESILLDGAPVVKDVVYQRTTVGTGQDWHTALVAGFGQASGGYYALDVTDPSFANRGTTVPNSFGPAVHTGSNTSEPPAYASSGAGGYMGPKQAAAASLPAPPWTDGNIPMGPHFLWQLMDSNLFASTGGTPAITTVSINDPDTTGHPLTEVGVAILPGGASTAGSGFCPRITCTSGASGCGPGNKIKDASPPGGTAGAYPLGAYVRQWNANFCPGTTATVTTPGLNGGATQNPAQGRSLTIVRIDTGEVLKTFTVMTDIPSNFALYQAYAYPSGTGNAGTNAAGFAYNGHVTQAEFDSPISGTPLPYPFDIGAVAQRVFVGDQDGTIWRLDVSNPDPNQWFVEPFFDAYNTTVDSHTNAALAADRAPIVGAPALSVGRDGNVVLNFGTGDTNFVGTATNPNFVYSVSEVSPQTVGVSQASAAGRLYADLNWYKQLPNGGDGEMITGPASVFDSSYYFSTFAPAGGASACTPGSAYIWGMDYTLPASSTGIAQVGTPTTFSNGGVYRLPSASGGSGFVQFEAFGSAIIPGVTITSSLSCATAQLGTPGGIDPSTGGPNLTATGATPPAYSVSFLEGQAAGAGAPAAVTQQSVAVTVHSSTLVDSWAAIVE